MRVRERLLQVVCLECVVRGLSYSAWGRFPPRLYMETFETDQINLPAKMHLDWCLSRFGRTPGSAGLTLPPLANAFLWYTAWWVLMSDGRCRGFVGQFGLSGGPLLDMLRRTQSSVVSSAYSSCFLLILDLCS